MPFLKRVHNILRYGVGPGAGKKKQADKANARQAAFKSDLWERGEELAQRRYNSYDDYITHQSTKLDKIIHRLQETETEDFADFKNRFQSCAGLSEARSVLCLGARLGTEVKALHSLGYFAVGIDLNPGPDNPYVLPGDFHRIVFPDGSVDAIYTNALDHVYDLAKVIGEVRRLLRPNGLFLADVIAGFEEGVTPGPFEATYWRNSASFIQKICNVGDFTLEAVRDIGQLRCDLWKQALFRRPA